MSELRTARERLYATIQRATDLISGPEGARLLHTAAWRRYLTLEDSAENERDPVRLTALLDQMDAALAELG
jgi:hypothetical protein